MTPAEFAARVRAMQVRTSQLPADAERIAQSEALRGIPRTVSVAITRNPQGVRVLLSGRGAQRHARALGPRLHARARELVRGVRP